MKRTLPAIICTCGVFFIAGCVGLAITEFRGLESVSITNELKEKNPLKVSKQEAKRIIILALGFPYMRPMVWNRRFKDLQLRVIYSELSKSERFKLVNFTEFDQAANRAVPGLYWDPLTEEQKREAIKEIGRQINADAILTVEEKGVGSAGEMVGNSLPQALFAGVMDRPTTLSFEMVSSKTGKTIWMQEEDIVYTSGKPFIKGMNDEVVIEVIRPSITPLVDNLLASFDASTTDSAPSAQKPSNVYEKADRIYLITIKNSNIRAAPNTKSQIINTIEKGTKIEKIDESRDWFEVKLPSGEIGHIFKPLVVVIP